MGKDASPDHVDTSSSKLPITIPKKNINHFPLESNKQATTDAHMEIVLAGSNFQFRVVTNSTS